MRCCRGTTRTLNEDYQLYREINNKWELKKGIEMNVPVFYREERIISLFNGYWFFLSRESLSVSTSFQGSLVFLENERAYNWPASVERHCHKRKIRFEESWGPSECIFGQIQF